MKIHYYLIIMDRNSFSVMIILKCHKTYHPLDVMKTYAKWNGVDSKDLIYTISNCADYNDVLANKDILEPVS